MFNFIFKKEPPKELPKEPPKELLTLENMVEMDLLTKEEMLKIKKDRAEREWENATGLSEKRSHHRKRY